MKNNLYTLLKADEKQVRKIVKKTLRENGYRPIVRKDFIYAEGTIPVLLVAHYDTFAEPPRYIKNEDGILSGRVGNKPHQLGADDRAGIYAILELIPKHHCHVLITGGEEHGGIGAEAFTRSGIEPEVNYCLQFDRRGSNDAVYYWADNPDFEEFITEHGWETAIGSFTDIVEICPYLGVMGVNLSIGYDKEHTTSETLDTKVMNENIQRFSKLLDGEKFEYLESYWKYGNYEYDDWDYDHGKVINIYDERVRRMEYEYIVSFIDDEGKEDDEFVVACDYFSAIGVFLFNNPTYNFNQIISCGRLAS